MNCILIFTAASPLRCPRYLRLSAALPDHLHKCLRDRILYEDRNPFLAEQFKQIDGGDDMRRDITDEEPAINPTTWEMITGGPIMSWFHFSVGTPKARGIRR
jgi:predicted metal-dependent RNase